MLPPPPPPLLAKYSWIHKWIWSEIVLLLEPYIHFIIHVAIEGEKGKTCKTRKGTSAWRNSRKAQMDCRHIFLFYKKCHFCHFPFAKVGQYIAFLLCHIFDHLPSSNKMCSYTSGSDRCPGDDFSSANISSKTKC